MISKPRCFGNMAVVWVVGLLVGCGDPRAVLLPLQYPDGSPVTTKKGEPVMAGYQTFGTAMHANTTALYERAAPPTCATCAKIGAVVSEPSTLRQTTGVLGTAAFGTGAVMTGIGVMDYGEAAGDGKLGTNVVNQGSTVQGSTVQGSTVSVSRAGDPSGRLRDPGGREGGANDPNSHFDRGRNDPQDGRDDQSFTSRQGHGENTYTNF